MPLNRDFGYNRSMSADLELLLKELVTWAQAQREIIALYLPVWFASPGADQRAERRERGGPGPEQPVPPPTMESGGSLCHPLARGG